MVNTFTLTNTAVSGSALKLASSNITYNWQNIVSDFPIPGKFDIVSTQYQGWRNPGFNLSFVIYIDNNPSGFITWEQWNLIVRNSSADTTLNLTIGDSDTAFKSYAHSASGVSSIPIQIVSFTTSIQPGTNVLIIDAQCIESV
jgi:hypothetical protein